METFVQTIILGLAVGSVWALASTGIVLTYRTSGILNFGFGAVALFTTFIYWQFAVQWGWPAWLAAIVVVAVVAPAVGVFLDTQLFRRIEGQPKVISVIATVGLTVLLQGVVFRIWGAETEVVPSLFPTETVKLPGGVNVGVDQFGILAIGTTAALLLGAMLKFTRIGVAFRAVVDNRPVAGLMAINTGLVSGMAWAVGTSFAALTGILLAPRILLEPDRLPLIVIAQVLGAAVVGYMRSLPWAYAGGLLIGITQALLIQYADFSGYLNNIVDTVPFLFVVVLVLFAPKKIRFAGIGTSFIVRTREIAEQTSRSARSSLGLGVFGALALFPLVASSAISWQGAITIGMTYSIIFLSLVILTGYSGQISLGHSAFTGIAAFTAAHIATDAGMSSWLALLLGALAAVPAGALIGIIAVRLHGLFLALVTLAFAFIAYQLFFTDPRISGAEGSIALPRPEGATSARGFYFLVLGVLAVCALLAVNLRSGRTGRVLAAIRDSETATRSVGIDVVKYKVIIFSLSAFVAGLGGVLFQMILESASPLDFFPFFSLVYLTLAVLGGIFHVGGAIASGMLFAFYGELFGQNRVMASLQFIFFGLGATLALAQNPEGFFGELRRGGNAILRAFRRPRTPEPLPVAGAQE